MISNQWKPYLLQHQSEANMYLLYCEKVDLAAPWIYLIDFDRPRGRSGTPTTFITSITKRGESFDLESETLSHTYDFSRELLYKLKDPRMDHSIKVYAINQIRTTYRQLDVFLQQESLTPGISLEVLFDQIVQKFGQIDSWTPAERLGWVLSELESKMGLHLGTLPYLSPWAQSVQNWTWN